MKLQNTTLRKPWGFTLPVPLRICIIFQNEMHTKSHRKMLYTLFQLSTEMAFFGNFGLQRMLAIQCFLWNLIKNDIKMLLTLLQQLAEMAVYRKFWWDFHQTFWFSIQNWKVGLQVAMYQQSRQRWPQSTASAKAERPPKFTKHPTPPLDTVDFFVEKQTHSAASERPTNFRRLVVLRPMHHTFSRLPVSKEAHRQVASEEPCALANILPRASCLRGRAHLSARACASSQHHLRPENGGASLRACELGWGRNFVYI